jgi:hypothetical protein
LRKTVFQFADERNKLKQQAAAGQRAVDAIESLFSTIQEYKNKEISIQDVVVTVSRAITKYQQSKEAGE